jgi:hypothetical protein
MVNQWLTEILSVPGVQGVFIASGRGSILHNEGVKIKESDLEDISLRLLRMSAIFNEKDENVAEIELFWKNLFIICKLSNNLMLVTICDTPKILPLLRITLNVSLSHLLQDKKIMKMVRNHAIDRNMVLRKGKFGDDELSLLSNI